jgi:hypothetical protein
MKVKKMQRIKIEWRPVVGHPEYSVSSDGRIYSHKTGRYMKGIERKRSGHICFFPNRKVKVYFHTAVLEAFDRPRPTGLECRHLDGNPKNNNLSNLKWGTRTENQQDTIAHGHKPMGENAEFSTISNDGAEAVRVLSKIGFSSRRIGAIFGVSHTTVQKIVRGQRYATNKNRVG